MSLPVFLCEDLAADVVVLGGAEGRHASAVRRIRVGEAVDLVDGQGTRCTCTVTSVTRESLTCQVITRILEPLPSPRITLVQALAKSGRGEDAVELATEVGVDAIVPWAAGRSIARAAPGSRLERWEATAREAAKQSRRAYFPSVSAVVTTEDVAALPGQLLVLHEEAATALSQIALPTGDLVLIVGPEGGIAADEVAGFVEVGAIAVRLGGSVLRTSTAGAVAIALVSSRTGRW